MKKTAALAQKARWTVYNFETKSVFHYNDEEFKEVLTAKNIKLMGKYIEVEFDHPEVTRIKPTQKIWVDATIN